MKAIWNDLDLVVFPCAVNPGLRKGEMMNATIINLLKSMEFGEPQCFRNITILPLKSTNGHSADYVTLGEALSSNYLIVSEIHQSGSVPQLKVLNRADKPVLLLDGEELLGSKQNRVLNTTILLKEKSETVIPVSCTEQGRWSYSSPVFAESDVLMAHKLRAIKLHSVSSSLEHSAGFTSNQGQVWLGIDALHAKAKTSSPTGAMHDVFKKWEEDLRQGLAAFQTQPKQKGLIVLVDGEVVGLDWVSREDAYARLHPKLVKSYVLEGLLDGKTATTAAGDAKAKVTAFLEQVGGCESRDFPSVGYGTDCRLQGRAVAGSALVHENQPVHAAVFRLETSAQGSSMAPLRERRRGLRME